MPSPRRFAALLILTSSACAHGPEPATPRATDSSATELPHAPSRPSEPAPDLALEPLVDAALFSTLMGYDPRLSTSTPAVCRVSFYEALELANQLSERSGLAPCYMLHCEGPATPGCAREGQPYCEDLRKCTASRNAGPCGYRLPTTGGGDGELAIWLEPETFGEVCLVGGRTRLSSPDTAPHRRAPTRCGLRADHIGIRLLAAPAEAPSPSESGAQP